MPDTIDSNKFADEDLARTLEIVDLVRWLWQEGGYLDFGAARWGDELVVRLRQEKAETLRRREAQKVAGEQWVKAHAEEIAAHNAEMDGTLLNLNAAFPEDGPLPDPPDAAAILNEVDALRAAEIKPRYDLRPKAGEPLPQVDLGAVEPEQRGQLAIRAMGEHPWGVHLHVNGEPLVAILQAIDTPKPVYGDEFHLTPEMRRQVADRLITIIENNEATIGREPQSSFVPLIASETRDYALQLLVLLNAMQWFGELQEHHLEWHRSWVESEKSSGREVHPRFQRFENRA